MKLLSAELTAEMRKARDRSMFGPTEEWRNMHAAAPTDATNSLVKLLKDLQLMYLPHSYDERISALLKVICDD